MSANSIALAVLLAVGAQASHAAPVAAPGLDAGEEKAARSFDSDAGRAKRRGKELTDALSLRGKGAFRKMAALEAALTAPRDERKSLFTGMLEGDGTDDTACLHLGGLLMEEGNYDGAVALYTEGLARNPAMAESYLRRRADAHLAAGRREDALRDVDTALKGSPQGGSTHLLRSRILVSMGRLDDAAASYEAAMRFGPHQRTAEDAFICGRLTQSGRAVEACRAGG